MADEISAGDRFGRLTVIAELPRVKSGRKYRRVFSCVCDCGGDRSVRLDHLRSGHTVSCGCFHATGRGPEYHGMEVSPEHGVWRGMKKRCYSPGSKGYRNYGGRGIKVCDRWHSFRAFYEDMGPRPSPDHQIDRIDNDKDYEPGNCRWATRAEQNRNRKDNRMLEFRGERMCMADWAKRFGMRKGTLSARLASGMSVEESLTTPVRQWIGAKGQSCKPL